MRDGANLMGGPFGEDCCQKPAMESRFGAVVAALLPEFQPCQGVEPLESQSNCHHVRYHCRTAPPSRPTSENVETMTTYPAHSKISGRGALPRLPVIRQTRPCTCQIVLSGIRIAPPRSRIRPCRDCPERGPQSRLAGTEPQSAAADSHSQSESALPKQDTWGFHPVEDSSEFRGFLPRPFRPANEGLKFPDQSR